MIFRALVLRKGGLPLLVKKTTRHDKKSPSPITPSRKSPRGHGQKMSGNEEKDYNDDEDDMEIEDEDKEKQEDKKDDQGGKKCKWEGLENERM